MREPFTETLPCPLGREGAQAKLRLAGAGLPLSRWRPGGARPAVFRQMVIAEVIGNPMSGQTPGTPVRCRAWVRLPVEDRFDPSSTPPNDRKRADAISLVALSTENTVSSRAKAR
jgi:hypothetical protein